MYYVIITVQQSTCFCASLLCSEWLENMLVCEPTISYVMYVKLKVGKVYDA